LAPETTSIWTERITYWMSRLLRWVSGHWLALANMAFGVLVGLPILAPVLAHWGYDGPAAFIYRVFGPLCHQLPERSFFLFGPSVTYSYDELAALLAQGSVPQRWVGSAGIGFKMAICERDIAVYGSMVLAGIAFNWLRSLRPLSVRGFLLFIAPMAVDGGGQLIGLWSSTWLTRVITGALFGVACIALTYPYLEQGMREVRAETSAALERWGR
jgi:uncharacterized membrane protein